MVNIKLVNKIAAIIGMSGGVSGHRDLIEYFTWLRDELLKRRETKDLKPNRATVAAFLVAKGGPSGVRHIEKLIDFFFAVYKKLPIED